jgi:flavin-dependent dehydrogenase
LHWGCAAKKLTESGLETDQGEVKGRFILGADGLYSPTQKWTGLYQKPKPSRRYGIRRHYQIAPWSGFVEVYWNVGCEAYVTPTGPNTVGVALLWRADAHRPNSEDLLAPFPRLRDRLQGCPFASHTRGAGPLARRPRAVQRGCVLLVGDASGYADAITGEGLSLGFRQAEAAISAITAGDARAYRGVHRKLVQRPFLITKSLCWVAQHPRTRQRLLAGLAKDPTLFSRSLDLMEGHKGWLALGLGRVLRLLRRLLWP